MTVKEVITVLSHFHEDAEVFVTWEGIRRLLGKDSFYADSKGNIYIDGDECCYKEDIVAGTHRHGWKD